MALRCPISLVLWTLVATAALCAQTTVAHADDASFVAQLRQQRLYRLADSYCRRQLARQDLTPQRRARLAVELSRTIAERAYTLPPSQREPLWQQALDIAHQYAAQLAESGWTPLLTMQASLVQLARAESLTQQAALATAGDSQRDAAREDLRAVLRELHALDQQITGILRPSPATHGTTGMSEAELRRLQLSARFQRARASRLQGETYPAGSADRVAAVRTALNLLTPLARLNDDEPLAFESRVAEVACHRLMGNFNTAIELLEQYSSRHLPDPVRVAFRVERVRTLVASGQLAAAIELLPRLEPEAAVVSPDWELARLETYVAAWRAADVRSDGADSARWQQAAVEVADQIEREYGGEWGQRATALLARSVVDAGTHSQLTALARAAAGLYRGGQLDDALAAYDQARQRALAGGETTQAFELGLTAAAIENERKNYAAAAERYLQLALGAPAHPRAAEAHLMGAFDLALAAKQSQPVDAALLEQYVASLAEHLQRWPSSPTAARARLWLARVRSQQGEWREAISLYSGIPSDAEDFAAALREIAACCDGALDNLSEDARRDELLTEVTNWLTRAITTGDGRLPERWSTTQREALLALARFRLRHQPEKLAELQPVLEAAGAGATTEWLAEARLLVAVSTIASGDVNAATTMLDQMRLDSPEVQLEILVGIDQIARQMPPEQKSQLAGVQVQLAEAIAPYEQRLGEAQRRAWKLSWARALAALGQADQALAHFQDVIELAPDEEVLEDCAALLAQRGDHQSLEAALPIWRQLEQTATSGSPRWFRAKYQMALAHHSLGAPERAAKIIRVTQVLHPELGGPEQREQFLALLAQCEP